MSVAVELRGVVRDFATVGPRGGKVRALKGLSLRVPAGQVVGLLGANGSGKSTTLKIILGLLAPTAGECRVFGRPSEDVAARRDVGYLPDAPAYPRHLTGRELVRFYAKICGVERRFREKRISDALERVGMTGAADRRVGGYSKGMLQRIGMAQALVHDPKLVILDEPAAGLDAEGADDLNEAIRRLKAERKTVLITSHLLPQIEAVCDRAAVLDQGELVAEGEVGALMGRGERQALIVKTLPEKDIEAARQWLESRGSTLEAVRDAPRVGLEMLLAKGRTR